MAQDVDQLLVAKGFKVEIAGHGFLAIQSYSGGDTAAEQCEATHGESVQGESTPGHVSVSEVTLVAFVNPKEKILADIANEVCVKKQQKRFDLTITELAKDKTPIKTYTYFDCLFTSLDYASVQAGTGELLTETFTCKPERCEVS